LRKTNNILYQPAKANTSDLNEELGQVIITPHNCVLNGLKQEGYTVVSFEAGSQLYGLLLDFDRLLFCQLYLLHRKFQNDKNKT
jgi:hypothetical protein